MRMSGWVRRFGMKRRRWRSPIEAKFKGYVPKTKVAIFRGILDGIFALLSAHFSGPRWHTVFTVCCCGPSGRLFVGDGCTRRRRRRHRQCPPPEGATPPCTPQACTDERRHAFPECEHHSAQRQRTARAWEEEREVHNTAEIRTTVPPPEPELFDLSEEPGGMRPSLLLEPHGVQDWLQRHRVEQALDVPVLRMTRDEVDVREYDIMEEVVHHVLQEQVQPRTGEQAHVHALGELVLLQRVQQRTAEQIVRVLVTVSESFV